MDSHIASTGASAQTIAALGVVLGLTAAGAIAHLFAPKGVAAVLAALVLVACFGLTARAFLDIKNPPETQTMHHLRTAITEALAEGQPPAETPTFGVGKRLHEYRRDTGEGRLFTCHPAEKCESEGCPIHHPSSHALRGEPYFVVDRPLIMRACPCEGSYRHPDPDSLAYIWRDVDQGNAAEWEVHECCPRRCCGVPVEQQLGLPAATTEEVPAALPDRLRHQVADAATVAHEMTAGRPFLASLLP